MKKINEKDLIKEFIKIHGNKYNYDNLGFTGMGKPCRVICNSHEEPFEFKPIAANHKKGSGCPKCAGILPLTNDEFVAKSKLVHGETYIYDKSVYVKSHQPLIIICKEHGEFLQNPNNHLSGKGCGKCANSILKTQFEAIGQFIEIHSDKYDYSNVIYKGADVEVEILCRTHNLIFKQTPRVHLRGGGCQLCANEQTGLKCRLTVDEVISRSKLVHGDAFNYDEITLEHSPLVITLKCTAKNHSFKQSFQSHLISQGCPICNGRTQGNTLNIIEKLEAKHGDKYDYSLIVNHYESKDKIPIICKTHGTFYQELSSHLSGAGCPTCGRQDSKGEIEVYEWLNSYFPDTVRRDRELIGKELDIYIPSKNFAVEYNGLYWHSDNPQNQSDARNRHKEKTDLCNSKNIRLFHLYEDDWEFRQEVVKHTLRHLLGLSEKSLFARKTSVKIHTLSEVKDFLNSYHMQGSAKQGLFAYCLYDESEMVAVMVFSKPSSERGNIESGRFELLRYACKYSVIGGASKLLKSFVKDNNPVSIVSYSDDGMFSGEMYKVLGFKPISKVKPDYKVIVGKERKHKSNFRLSNLSKILGDSFDPDLSETGNCHNNGFYRIYNSGLTKWEFTTQ